MAKVSIRKELVKIFLASWMSAKQYFPVLPRNVENDELGSTADNLSRIIRPATMRRLVVVR